MKSRLFSPKYMVLLAVFCGQANAHYPVLNCAIEKNKSNVEEVSCEASFSDRSRAPNVIMEVFSEDDEQLAKGRTNENSIYRFNRPKGAYFIIMDAGPGHVLEISDEDVNGI